MLFRVKKEDVIEGLQKAAGIIPTRAGAAYLRSLWMKAADDTLTLMATDANIEFTGSYGAQVGEPGLVGVNGRNLVDLIRRLPNGELRFRLEAGATSLIVEQGRRTYKLPANDPTWFQDLAAFPTEGAVVWSGDFFQEMLDRVLFCVSDEEGSDAIGCLFINPLDQGRIDVCGLNGHQLARATFTHDELAARLPEQGILLQKKYVSELRKWLNSDEVEVTYTEKRFFVRSINGSECLSLPRAGFSYPNYAAFLARLEEDGFSRLTLDRRELIEALDRIAIFNTDADRCAYFDLTGSEAVLSAQGQDTGSANESIEVSYDGAISRIAFPTKNLMDILTHFQSPKLTLTLTSTEGPCGINGTEDLDYIVLIMPMKIAEQNYYAEE